MRVDLCDRKDVYRVAEEVRREVGDVTIVINNAGVVSGKPLLDIDDASIQRTFDVNVLAHFWVNRSQAIFIYLLSSGSQSFHGSDVSGESRSHREHCLRCWSFR